MIGKDFDFLLQLHEDVFDLVCVIFDLVVGLLVVENGPTKVSHQEHSPILLHPGKYVIGRQIESVAGEERRVAD